MCKPEEMSQEELFFAQNATLNIIEQAETNIEYWKKVLYDKRKYMQELCKEANEKHMPQLSEKWAKGEMMKYKPQDERTITIGGKDE